MAQHDDVDLDLGRVFQRAYETAPYPVIARYDRALDPALPPGDEAWVRERLESRGVFRQG